MKHIADDTRGRPRRLAAGCLAVALLALGACSNQGPTTPVQTATAAVTEGRSGPSVESATPSATPVGTSTPTGKTTTKATTNLPSTVTQERPGWALDRIDQRKRPLNHKFTTTGQGQGVTVYVVDGLFQVTNPEFGGRASIGRQVGQSCVLEDGINHGEFVAGLVAGNHTGVAKKAKIVVVGSSYGCEGGGGGTEAQAIHRIVRALDWVDRHAVRPAVVNLSLNVTGPVPELTAAVKRLTDAGLTVVASAGNDGNNACNHPPAGLPKVITVTGSTKADTDAGLNHGSCVDLFAPAQGVRSVVDGGISPNHLATSDISATSWAAPLASGTAALYLSVHPNAGPGKVRNWLIDNATTGALHGNLHGSPNRLLYVRGPL